MLSEGSIFSMVVTAVFIENIVLVQFLGICPFIGVSKKTGTALGMGMAVMFVMTLSSALCWLSQKYLLAGMEYLQTVTFILIIASLVQLVEMVLMKTSPALYSSLGIYLPLITTNCAVLGVAILSIQKGYGFIETIIYSISAALGFLIAIYLFAGVRVKLTYSNVPKFMQGVPIAMVTAGLIAIVFLGFQGLEV